VAGHVGLELANVVLKKSLNCWALSGREREVMALVVSGLLKQTGGRGARDQRDHGEGAPWQSYAKNGSQIARRSGDDGCETERPRQSKHGELAGQRGRQSARSGDARAAVAAQEATTISDVFGQSLRAREGECELGTLAIGKRCQERISEAKARSSAP
jgi:hypothetical protein